MGKHPCLPYDIDSLGEDDLFYMTQQEFLGEQRKTVMFVMRFILGTHVDVAVADHPVFDVSFQIMCDGDSEYFIWYCWKYPYNQFHKTPILAAMNYLKFRDEWYMELIEKEEENG